MRARLKVSRAGVELIKSFEGLRQTATRLPDGRWTLGYGHTFSAREGAKVTQEDADALLRFDLLPIVDSINNQVLTPLNQNQFDALVSFCFNIGVENFTASTVLKRINEGRVSEAAQAMDAWRSAEFNGQTYVLAPLIRRRAAEKSLFLTPEDIDHASVMTMRPVEDVSAAPEEPVVMPQSASSRQVIDLSTYTSAAAAPITPQPPAAPMESLPGGLTPNAIREDVPEAEEAVSATEVQAALQRAKDEQAQREEALRQAQAQAQALAEARAAEQARLAREADERARNERQEQEAARAAEAARVEAARLEAARLEQARLEQARLENERREREAARVEAARVEAAKTEVARMEQDKQAAEQRAREAEAVASPPEVSAAAPDDAIEKARKAEAAAALMRLYSPYGGGPLGRPLTAPRAVTPPASEGFVQHSVMTPGGAQSTSIEIAAQPENLSPQTPEAKPAGQPVQTFASVTSATSIPAPVVTALNPYARPQAVPENVPEAVPEAREVPRPAVVDMAAQPQMNWREQLDRPLPQNHQSAEPASIFAQTEQRNLGEQTRLQEHGFGAVDESYGDDAGWTLDGGRIAMSSDTDEPEHASWWTMIVSTFWWIFISGLGLGCLGVAAGAYYKSRDAVVIRNGAVPDYMTWSVVMAAVGILCVSVSLWLIMKRLGGLKD